MEGLKSSIRNKIAGNLIKVYSIMVSSAIVIVETFNETRKITNPKSQWRVLVHSWRVAFQRHEEFYVTTTISC